MKKTDKVISYVKEHRVVLSLIFLALIVLLSRLPLLQPGYGYDEDAWMVFRASRHIAETGEYVVSRVEGHPVQEYVCSVFYKGGPVVLNGITAFFSVVSAILFALILRKLNIKYYFLGGLTLAFIPVVYINSCNSMDYVWALAFVLGAVYALLFKRTIVAGVLLGIAVGCRSTTVLMALPLSLLIVNAFSKDKRVTGLSVFLVSFLATILLAYTPYILTYGLEIPPVIKARDIGIVLMSGKATLGVWGIFGAVGFFGILIAFLFSVFLKREEWSNSKIRGFTLVSISVLLIYSFAFFVFPAESGYLIITLPFLIALFAIFLNRRVFWVFCAITVLSPFFPLKIMPQYPTYNITGPGYTTLDIRGNKVIINYGINALTFEQKRRRFAIDLADIVLKRSRELDKKSVVVSGSTNTLITSVLPGNTEGNAVFEYILNETEVKVYKDDGYDIYFTPGIDMLNIESTGTDLRDYGGKPLLDVDEIPAN